MVGVFTGATAASCVGDKSDVDGFVALGGDYVQVRPCQRVVGHRCGGCSGLACQYAQAAAVVDRLRPQGSPVMFSGYRDDAFIFNMHALKDSQDLNPMRADKLLLGISARRDQLVAWLLE